LPTGSHGFSNINYNSFAPLLDYNIECYKCNNYVDITHYCRRSIVIPLKKTRKKMFLPRIDNNTQSFGKGNKSKKQGEMKLFVMRKDVII
jgi:hypothetical protein